MFYKAVILKERRKSEGIQVRKDVLLKLIKKALIYRLMANLDRFINEAELTHREISSSTAKSQS